MSLFAHPVLVSDLEQLQLGIVFFTNTAEATSETAQINNGADTVYNYAVRLLANNISLSQVAMAVDSLMFGQTDNTTELAKLTTQFLPPQIVNALNNGFNTTVYAAEALGLGLAGGNGTSNNFATNFGSLSVQQFADAVSNITGTHADAIVQFVNDWITFYTANPSATHGLSITLASYGAAFGDAVGVALLNPPPIGPNNQPSDLPDARFNVVQNDVYNALKDNAEGSYVAGVDISALPPETPLQGEGPIFLSFFTLTISQDTFIGRPAGGTPFNAPLSGQFGGQPSLTNNDSLTASGPDNVLNATFDGDHTASSVNIVGVQTWNIDETANGTVGLSGGPGAVIQGLTTLNYNDNGCGGSLNVGTAALPILPATGGTFDVFTLNIANAPVTGNGNHEVDVAMSATGFNSAGQTIFVTVTSVGSTGDGLFDSAYGIGAGSPTIGFTTWNITSSGGSGNTNDLKLGADGNSSATHLVVTDDGAGTVLWAAGSDVSGSVGSGAFENLTTINGSGTTGPLTITGGENGSPDGLLASNGTALTDVTGGTGPDLFDLSASTWDVSQFADVSIDGGGNTTGTNFLGGIGTSVELSNSEINTISTVASQAFAEWTGIAALYDVGLDSDVGGAVNMADFPGTLMVNLLNTDSTLFPEQNADLSVTSAPNNFTFDFNFTTQTGHNFNLTGVNTAGDTATVNYGVPGNQLPGVGPTDSTGAFVSHNFENVNINVFGDNGGVSTLYEGGIVAAAAPGDAEVLSIDTSQDLLLDASTEPGTSGLSLHGGFSISPTTGALNISGKEVIIGVTNASVINETGLEFLMESPDSAITLLSPIAVPTYSGITVTAAGVSSTLQGSLGPVTTGPLPTAIVGNDTLTDTTGASSFLGDGGADTLNLGGGHNDVFFGEYFVANTPARQSIMDGSDAFQGFWGIANGQGPTPVQNLFGNATSGGTSADITTLNGFSLGTASDDALSFNVSAWNGSLVNGVTLAGITDTSALGNTQLVTAPGTTLAAPTTGHTVDLVLYDITTEPNAQALAGALPTGDGNINLGTSLNNNAEIDMLVAYSTGIAINIADVHFVNTSGTATSNTANMHVFASDMVSIVGQTSLAALSANAGDIIFIHV
jgi:hypothetical protein